MKSKRSVENPDISNLTTVRNSILLFLQDPASGCDLKMPIEKLKALGSGPLADRSPDAAATAAECVKRLKSLSRKKRKEADLRYVLDKLVEIEAALLDDPTGEDLSNISAFVDESFEHLTHPNASEEPASECGFEIDDETLEIFRTEAGELLNVISTNLNILSDDPREKDALWEMRRAVHTLKGAAGVIGMSDASRLSHRVEDLLGEIVDHSVEVTAPITDLLKLSFEHLNLLSEGADPESGLKEILKRFDKVMGEIAPKEAAVPVVPTPSLLANNANTENSEVAKPPTPIIRVSLDRLYDLQTIAHELALSRTTLADRLDEFADHPSEIQRGTRSLLEAKALLAHQLGLANELQEKLEQIRLVRFGMLATRLNRAVNVTCQEENKKAELILENEDVELDTQIIDALVEPLLHLLRNAVVHGIEPSDVRRMIGKSEKAQIVVNVERTAAEIILSVSDNGRGVTLEKLKDKAMACGSVSKQVIDSLSDEETLDLIFLRGVTTADKLSLNAGRGIGMSIVRQGVESRGGSISIHSEPQRGSVFTIRMPSMHQMARHRALPELKYETVSQAFPEQVPIQEPKPVIPIETMKLPVREPMPVLRSISEEVPLQIPKTDLSVLIVDDSELMRQTISKVVERAGWKALSATEGSEALLLLAKVENRPDIIITDLEMPGMGGLGFIQALKNNPKLYEIPVIMITSRTERSHREKAFALGAAKYLTKPIEGAELKSIINGLCLAEAA